MRNWRLAIKLWAGVGMLVLAIVAVAVTVSTQSARKSRLSEAAIHVIETRYNTRIPAYLAALRALADYQRAELAAAQAYFEDKRRQNMIFGTTSMGLLVLGILVGAYFLIRHIRQPLQRTVVFANTLAGGDLTDALDSARQDEFGEMTRALEAMRSQLVGLVTEGQRLGELIAHSSHASQEQARGVGDINEALGHLDQMTQQNAALVEATAAAAMAMRERAHHLAAQVQRFRLPSTG